MGGAVLFTPLWRLANPLVANDQAVAVAANTPVKLTRFIKDTRPPGPSSTIWSGAATWNGRCTRNTSCS